MNKSVTYDDLFQACVYLDTNISERVEYEEDRQRLKHIADILEYVSKEIVKHGYWIGIEFDGYADGFPVYSRWECSECGNEIETEDTPLYCCDCGACMDEEVGEDAN